MAHLKVQVELVVEAAERGDGGFSFMAGSSAICAKG